MELLVGIPHMNLLIKEASQRRLEAHGLALIVNKSGKMAERSFLEKHLQRADAYIAGGEIIDRNLLERTSRLKIIARYGVGLDTIDVACASQRGIVVTTTAGANASSVAEHTIMLMLSVMRRTTYYQKAISNGCWDIVEFPELTAKTIGLIGFGRIGRLVALKLSGFSPNIIVFDPYVSEEEIGRLGFRKCQLDDLLGSADVVSLHMPNTEGVQIIGKSELIQMQSSAFLINTARGSLIDEDALYWALSNNIIAGAGLDVVQSEPCCPGHRLLELPNVVLTPHIAGGSRENHEKAGEICVAAVIDVLFNARVPETAVNRSMVDGCGGGMK